MEKLPSFVKREGDSIIFNSDGEFCFYIPEKHFELTIAKYIGECISMFGIVTYSVQLPGDKKPSLHLFNCPTMFVTKPSLVEKLKDVKLTANTPKQDYRVLKYTKGSPIIISTKVPEDITNVEALMKLFIISGYIPNTIPYDKIQFYMLDNMKANGNNYGLHLQIFGVVLSEICRNPENLEQAFRLSKSKDMTNYKSISVKQVAKMASAYSAFTSENFDEAVIYSSLNNRDADSPLQKTMMNNF